MTATAHRRVANAVAVLSTLILASAQVITYLTDPAAVVGYLIAGAAFTLGFGGVGWLLWHRLPHNPIGWCFSLAAPSAAVAYLAHAWATFALADRDTGSLTRAAAMLDTNGWIVAVPLAITLPLLVLPGGRLISARWRPVVWMAVVGCAAASVGTVTQPGPIDQPLYRHLDNPFGVSGLGRASQMLALGGLTAMLVATVAGVVAVVLRFRRSAGIERQQLRWVALGGCFAVLGISVSTQSQEPGGRGLVAGITSAIAMSLLPSCIGVAVLRYRLYDLGRVVSRTVSYAVLTALLVTVYLVIVTASARLVPDGSSLTVAASTMAVAALFSPLRRRVQTSVDRRFNRARYDSDRTVESFTRRLRVEVDLDDVRADLLDVVRDTLQPTTAGLWLRDPRRT